jgi:cytochrome b561
MVLFVLFLILMVVGLALLEAPTSDAWRQFGMDYERRPLLALRFR